jgi:hypothetical protein
MAEHDPATVELVVEALTPGRNADRDTYRRQARAVLDALIADGWVRADPAEPHLIEFRADGWTIQHPLRCRPNLFACQVNRMAGDQIGGPPASGLGVYECDVDDDGTFMLNYPAHEEAPPAGLDGGTDG